VAAHSGDDAARGERTLQPAELTFACELDPARLGGCSLMVRSSMICWHWGRGWRRAVRAPGLEDHPILGRDRHGGHGHPARGADVHGPARGRPHHRRQRRAPVHDLQAVGRDPRHPPGRPGHRVTREPARCPESGARVRRTPASTRGAETPARRRHAAGRLRSEPPKPPPPWRSPSRPRAFPACVVNWTPATAGTVLVPNGSGGYGAGQHALTST
jgi:hypothetical protein